MVFSGQIPYGDGNVSIRADSGILYQVPAMSPVGIIQALAGTGMIGEYRVGDELLEKRGVFTLDGVNSYTVSEYDTWYITVNGVQLREFLLPAKEGINTFKLADGDDILFAYGDPTLPVGAAKALIWVQIGNKNGMMQYLSPLQMPASYQVIQQPVPVIIPTIEITTVPTAIPTTAPVVEVTTIPMVNTTATPVVEVTAVPTVLPSTAPVVEVTAVPTVLPTSAPVVEVTAVPTVLPTATPVVEVTAVPTVLPTTAPVVEVTAVPTVTPTVTTEPAIINNTTDSQIVESETPVPETTNATTDDNGVLYSGVYTLPEGTVNVTVNSGLDYEIPAKTPLGLLHLLFNDKILNNISIDDRGMRKGKILIVDGINEYFSTASKIWFVRVNGNTLRDYENPDEGLNIFNLQTGDDVSFYYGNPEEPFQDAEVMMFVTLG
ncbi:hypothetical protein DLD82_08465 [Methanospirillum stamsii]|uniref:DUF4430 domain-containing protein n=1 Tax=Methanospirillum stamsii TaxID=1277351 RepID=A0A2V2N2X6_9EURY|nr:hypothetical protein DLD82_08465 [Methanospirillum stamsii]